MMYLRWLFLLAVVVTAIAAWTDWRKGIIPNWLTLGALALGIILHTAIGYGRAGGNAAAQGAMYSALGALACGAVPLLLYVVGGGRGGDVKLFAALGALMRTTAGIEVVFYSFVIATIVAQAKLAYEGKLMATLANSAFLLINPFLPRSKRRPLSAQSMTWMKLGPSIFVGTVVAVLLHWRLP